MTHVYNPSNDSNFAMATKVWPGTVKLIEEMGELQQVLGKLIMTGGDTKHWSGDLRPRLVEELADVMAALQFFSMANLSTDEIKATLARSDEKLVLFHEWTKKSG
jgi:hypothetical protein